MACRERSRTVRVFFALWPNQEARNALALAGECLKSACGGRLMRKDTLHLTLVFLGAVPEHRLPELKSLAARIEVGAFELMLDKTGWWPHNRIAWAAPKATPEPLQELVSQLQAALRQAGFDFDGRQEFAPHVTLLRDARCAAGMQLESVRTAWRVGHFALVQSVKQDDGRMGYEIAGSWGLEQ